MALCGVGGNWKLRLKKLQVYGRFAGKKQKNSDFSRHFENGQSS